MEGVRGMMIMLHSFLSGIKKDTRAVKKVFRVKISQPHISYISGIKNNTRAVKEAIGLMIVSSPYSQVFKIIPVLRKRL